MVGSLIAAFHPNVQQHAAKELSYKHDLVLTHHQSMEVQIVSDKLNKVPLVLFLHHAPVSFIKRIYCTICSG